MNTSSASFRCAYQTQDSPMTVREGLAEYYRANPEITQPGEGSAIGEVFFASHDVTHVVFGTTTSVRDEAINDMWSMFALDIPAREYISRGLDVPEVKALFTLSSMWEFLVESLRLPLYIPTIRRHAKAMTKPWPWKGFESYLDLPLAEVRREFGIEVIDFTR